MGAFLLIAVMALPYYLKVDKDLVKQVGQLKNELQEVRRTPLKSFGAVTMRWSSDTPRDVDLYVEDPEGRLYFFDKRRYPEVDAEFTVDAKAVNAGAEVWITPQLHPGTYKLYYCYYDGTGPVDIQGRIFTRTFTADLPTRTMARPDPRTRKLIAEIRVTESGEAVLHDVNPL